MGREKSRRRGGDEEVERLGFSVNSLKPQTCTGDGTAEDRRPGGCQVAGG